MPVRVCVHTCVCPCVCTCACVNESFFACVSVHSFEAVCVCGEDKAAVLCSFLNAILSSSIPGQGPTAGCCFSTSDTTMPLCPRQLPICASDRRARVPPIQVELAIYHVWVMLHCCVTLCFVCRLKQRAVMQGRQRWPQTRAQLGTLQLGHKIRNGESGVSPGRIQGESRVSPG